MIRTVVNFFGDAKYRRRRWWLFLLVLAATLIADFLVERHAGKNFWDAIPGWGALIGLISCLAIILFAKSLGHRALMKDEDYYD